jgi:biopolymer transport protein TolR
MGMDAGGGGTLKSDINVTPLVDVVLVLLIIFMVITPLTQRAYDIEIPREAPPTQTPPDADTKQTILAVNEQECPISTFMGPGGLPPSCVVRINKEPCPISDLARRMGEILKNRKGSEKVLFLAAEEKLNYEGIVRILDVAKTGAGDDLKIGIVTDERLARPPAAEPAAATGG